jgi:ribose transport system substrate-binding protein
MQKMKAVVAGLVASTLFATACGSSGSKAATPSNLPATGGPTTDAAQQATQAALRAPVAIGVTTPLASAPPKGKTVVFLQCEESQCGLQGEGMAAAAKALGWNYKSLSWQQANPATLVSALNQALQYNPVGVAFAGPPEALWASVIPAYQKAGVLITPSFVPDVTPTDVVAPLASNDFSTYEGRTLANFVIADSNAKAQVLFETVSSYPTFKPLRDAFTQTLTQACPTCKMSVLDSTIPQLIGGQIPGAVVSELRKAPSTNYVVTVDGAFLTGLTSQLSTAGLSGNFKIVSGSGSAQNQSNVKRGVEAATIGSAFRYSGWLAVDAMLRHLAGMPIPAGDGGIPTQLLTKDTVGTPSDSYDLPSDYAAQFQRLWNV